MRLVRPGIGGSEKSAHLLESDHDDVPSTDNGINATRCVGKESVYPFPNGEVYIISHIHLAGRSVASRFQTSGA